MVVAVVGVTEFPNTGLNGMIEAAELDVTGAAKLMGVVIDIIELNVVVAIVVCCVTGKPNTGLNSGMLTDEDAVVLIPVGITVIVPERLKLVLGVEEFPVQTDALISGPLLSLLSCALTTEETWHEFVVVVIALGAGLLIDVRSDWVIVGHENFKASTGLNPGISVVIVMAAVVGVGGSNNSPMKAFLETSGALSILLGFIPLTESEVAVKLVCSCIIFKLSSKGLETMAEMEVEMGVEPAELSTMGVVNNGTEGAIIKGSKDFEGSSFSCNTFLILSRRAFFSESMSSAVIVYPSSNGGCRVS